MKPSARLHATIAVHGQHPRGIGLAGPSRCGSADALRFGTLPFGTLRCGSTANRMRFGCGACRHFKYFRRECYDQETDGLSIAGRIKPYGMKIT